MLQRTPIQASFSEVDNRRLVQRARNERIFEGSHHELDKGTDRLFNQLYDIRYGAEVHGNVTRARATKMVERSPTAEEKGEGIN